jgi:hypothetical protein
MRDDCAMSDSYERLWVLYSHPGPDTYDLMLKSLQ